MSQQELLIKVVQTLEKLDIPYMLTGSIVSSLQGEPRATNDIDLLVAIRPSNVKKLIQSFPSPDYYLDEQSVHDAIAHKSEFNLIDTREGDKVDFWILTDDLYDTIRFSRGYWEDLLGVKMRISSPEDTILSKLRWAKLCGGSEKQFHDAQFVYQVQAGELDIPYMEHWVQALGIESSWKRLIS